MPERDGCLNSLSKDLKPEYFGEITSSSPFGNFFQYVCLPVNSQRFFCMFSWYFNFSYLLSSDSHDYVSIAFTFFSYLHFERFYDSFFSFSLGEKLKQCEIDAMAYSDSRLISWIQEILGCKKALESIPRKECTVSSLKQ